MAQNHDLESKRKDFKFAVIDDNMKTELRNSHFIFGNQTLNYQTASQTQFKELDKNKINRPCHSANPSTRAMSYKPGNDKVEYISESQIKYSTPKINSDFNRFYFKFYLNFLEMN